MGRERLKPAVGDVRRADDAMGDVRLPQVPDVPGSPGLHDYTGLGYGSINRYLRGEGSYPADETAALQARVDRISRELAGLPPKPGTTYRGTYLSPQQAARYESGQVVTERSFTSTSTDVQSRRTSPTTHSSS